VKPSRRRVVAVIKNKQRSCFQVVFFRTDRPCGRPGLL